MLDDVHGRGVLASLDHADIVAVQTGAACQLVLRHTRLVAHASEVDYPASLTVLIGWHGDGQGWVVTEYRTDVPVVADNDRRSADVEIRVDDASEGATSSLDLRPVVAAAVVLMTHLLELALEAD